MTNSIRKYAYRSLILLAALMPGLSHGQTPWATHGTGNQLITDLFMPGNAYGYKFTPNVDGSITGLGGYFNGTCQVLLYDTLSKTELAQTNVTSNNAWTFSSLANPVNVQAGTQYTVALNNSFDCKVSFKTGLNFPFFPITYGDITIDDSVWGMANLMPDTSQPQAMYGQVDVQFEATQQEPEFPLVTLGVLPKIDQILNPANIKPLMVYLGVSNNSNDPLTFRFNTTKEFDIVLKDETNMVVFRWSDGKEFQNIIHTRIIAPGETAYFGDFIILTDNNWQPLPEGSYTLSIMLTSTPDNNTSHPVGSMPIQIQSPIRIDRTDI